MHICINIGSFVGPFVSLILQPEINFNRGTYTFIAALLNLVANLLHRVLYFSYPLFYPRLATPHCRQQRKREQELAKLYHPCKFLSSFAS